jgi:hypothetical protein
MKRKDDSDRVDVNSSGVVQSARSVLDESRERHSGTESYGSSSVHRTYSMLNNVQTSSGQQAISRTNYGATTCACLNKGHYNNLVMDTKFTGSVEKMYNLLFTCDFLELFLKKVEKCSGMQSNVNLDKSAKLAAVYIIITDQS